MILGSETRSLFRESPRKPRCSELCSDRVGKPQIGTRQERVVLERFGPESARFSTFRERLVEAWRGLANRRLRPLGHLTANAKCN